MSAIEIKDLKYRYDKTNSVYALNGVSLNVEKGEYVTIIGHNGSGKSTLAKLIIGLLEKESGSIKIFDEELTEETVYDIRKKTGIVFQNPDNQFIGSTVRDDIAFGLENRMVPHEEMEPVILKYAEKVSMSAFLDKEPSALSGGQKQRVAIAGVLAMGPSIIIMDEATAMLDPRGKGEIIALTHQLKKENPDLTIISITHDIEEAFLSDRVIVLNKGEVLYNDMPSEVFTHEEELLSIGLDIPFLAKLKKLLSEQGITLSDASTREEIAEKLCQ